MALSSVTMTIKDMYCRSCEEKLQVEITHVAGVSKVKASLRQRSVWVEFDAAVCTPADIESAVNRAGYSVGKADNSKFLGIALLVAAIILLGEHAAGIDMDTMLSQQVSYMMLFTIGALTSLHCVGMCGGIMMSQTIVPTSGSDKSLKPAVLYNTGRLLSYTATGALVGALGSAIAVSLSFKAGITLVAGSFMVLMGLNLIGFKLPLPLPGRLKLLCAQKLKAQGPFAIGLLNGLLPCGPLQTMQVYALGTGSVMAGATAMFFFGLGTWPLMLPLGLITGWLSKNYAGRILKFSGVLVIVLGIIMANRGLAIAGIHWPWAGSLNPQTANATVAKAEIKGGVQFVRIAANDNGYVANTIVVQKNIPVKWIVDGQQINSCNNEIIVPSLQIQKKLRQGENVIEFTPGDTDIRFSCWMGMIQGVIKVVDNLDTADIAGIEPLPASASCCGSGGCCSGGGNDKASIYGNDITQVPTERLITKAVSKDGLQTAAIRGVGSEFEPLVVLVAQNQPAKLVFNLEAMTEAEGKYEIIDNAARTALASFIGHKGLVTVQLKPRQPGSYVVVKQGRLLGVIEVVADLDAADPEEVRKKLF